MRISDFAIHNYEKLDNILVELCEMIIHGQQKNTRTLQKICRYFFKEHTLGPVLVTVACRRLLPYHNRIRYLTG